MTDQLRSRLVRVTRETLDGYRYNSTGLSAEAVVAALLQELREQRTITTLKDLDALPCGSVIGIPVADSMTVYERVLSDWDVTGGLEWWSDGQHDPNLSGSDLPALLLWHPVWVSVSPNPEETK